MAEIEAMRKIEPIGGELQPVSKPPPKPLDPKVRNEQLAAMFGGTKVRRKR